MTWRALSARPDLEMVEPLGRHRVWDAAQRDGRDVVPVGGVAPCEGFEELQLLLDEEPVDFAQEPEARARVIEHLGTEGSKG